MDHFLRRSERAVRPLHCQPQNAFAGTSRPTSFAGGCSTAPTSFCPTGSLWRIGSTFSRQTRRFYFSQIQGRTYANMFGLVERYIGAKVLELSRDLARRSGGTRGAGPVQRRRVEAPGIVPSGRSADCRGNADRATVSVGSKRGRRCGTEQEQLGRAGVHPAHRALHAIPLSRKHSTRTPFCRNFTRTSFSFTGRRNANTQSWTNWSGAASMPALSDAARNMAVDELIQLVGAVDGDCARSKPLPTADYFAPGPVATG